MTRYVFFLLAAIGVIALFASAPWAKRALWAGFLLLAVYAVLKATGVIEARAPDRSGVL